MPSCSLLTSSSSKTGQNLARFLFLSLLTISAVFATISDGVAQEASPALYENKDQIYTPELARVRTLIRANVLDLAQSLLETEGPPDIPSPQWISWERQTWALLRVRGKWEKLYSHTRRIPPVFPSEIHREADINAINALNQLKRGKQSRVLIRKHLISQDISEFEKRKFRKLLIESYLSEGLLLEARIAMQSYQQDFRSEEQDWILLSAEVHLKLGDADAAVNLLAPLDGNEARLLRIYARLLNNSISPTQALSRVNVLLKEARSEAISPGRYIVQLHSVIVYASRRLNSPDSFADSLEQYLIAVSESGSKDNYSGPYPQYDSVDLLAAYQAVTFEEANLSGLLIGDENRLLNHALQLSENYLIRKRSLYGYLIGKTTDNVLQLQVNNFYIVELMNSDRTGLISVLYGDGNPFLELRLGGTTGLALSNFALENGDVQLAAAINQTLTEIPSGMNEREWLLHSSRISIIAGQYKQGTDSLHKLISSYSRLTQEETDQILQPIFDLQTVQQHKLALGLLHEVEQRASSIKHEREIAYWLAQSYQGNREFTKAADYYLYSAMQKDNGYDQWGKSARFQAAESLLSAKLVDDAKALFEGLLNRAEDDNRKAQLRRKLQELWLVESSLIQADPEVE